jgi:DNA-binding transcriptional LysR family regulator
MLDSYQHFLWVVETGSFSAAARRAHLSQPALSASIKKLEEHVGARLFERRPRGAVLTAAGRALEPRVVQALSALERGRREVAEVEGLARGEVRIAGGATACTYWLPPVLADFRLAHPFLTVRLREVFTTQVAQAVAEGQVELGIGEPGHDLPHEPLLFDPLVVVASPELAALWPDGLVPDAPVVVFPPGSSLRTLLDRHAPDVDRVMEVRSFGAVKGLVRAGIGLALLSASSVADDLAAGRLVEVPWPAAPRPREVHLVHAGVERLSPAARALREALVEAMRR